MDCSKRIACEVISTSSFRVQWLPPCHMSDPREWPLGLTGTLATTFLSSTMICCHMTNPYWEVMWQGGSHHNAERGHDDVCCNPDSGKISNIPKTFTGLVVKVRKKLSPEGGREGGEKSVRSAPASAGAQRTYRVLGEGAQLHATGVV